MGPYSKFYVEFLSQALRAMAYLHEVKIAVHFDFIERNLMVVDEEDTVTKTDGLFPEKFHIGVIDYGFVENLDSLVTPGSVSLPTLHPTHPFGMTVGSGRPEAREIPEDRVLQMTRHDLSVLAARSMELMVPPGLDMKTL